MGALFHGKWVDALPAGAQPTGSFKDSISADGKTGFPAEGGRYHLYAAVSCPFANRVMIIRALKKLDRAITMADAQPNKTDQGFAFDQGADAVNNLRYIHELYTLAKPDFTGGASVPALYDRVTKKIVNNESLDLLRMFDLQCEKLSDAGITLYPTALRGEIDKTIGELLPLPALPMRMRMGTEAEARDLGAKLRTLLETLDRRLADRRFLCGEQITEADIVAYTPLIRYDALFADGMRVPVPKAASFPNLHAYLRDLHQTKGFGDVVDLPLLARSMGVNADEAIAALQQPHGREKLGAGGFAKA